MHRTDRADPSGRGIPSSDAQAAPHWLVLGACLALLLLAFVMAWFNTGTEHLTVGSVQLPSICAFRNTTGLPCPGCGLTRSWVALAAGELRRSLQFHRLGWLLMLYALLQALRHGAWLALPAARDRLKRPGAWLDRGVVVLALLLLLNWPFTLWLAVGAR